MNDEIKEILDWLKDEDIYIEDYGYQYKRISLRETKLLLDYITNLQQKIEQYENPDDMTLFYMWLDVKAKDKMKELEEENEILKENNSDMQEEMARVWEENERLKEWKKDLLNENIELENIRKEAIEYIDKQTSLFDKCYFSGFKDLLNILQNGSENDG